MASSKRRVMLINSAPRRSMVKQYSSWGYSAACSASLKGHATRGQATMYECCAPIHACDCMARMEWVD